MNKKIVLSLVFAVSIFIGACAQPEEELLMEDQGITEALESFDGTEAGADDMTKVEDVTSDDGRIIQENYGEGDYTFKIDAEVYVSSQPVESGNLSTKNIDIELVETYLCDGEKLIKGSGNYEYISSGNSLDNDLDYDIRFADVFDSPGSMNYENWRLDQYYSGGDFELRAPSQWDEEEKSFVEAMAEKTEELFGNLGIEAVYSGADLNAGVEGSGAEDNCYIQTISMLDGFSLISLQMNDFMRNYCHIGEEGVNGLQLNGIFQKEDEKKVSVIPLDTALSIVKEGVEEKNINTYDEEISRIELAYMVNFMNGQPSFYPVWCFGVNMEMGETLVPVLCINAQTGSVAYMSR